MRLLGEIAHVCRRGLPVPAACGEIAALLRRAVPDWTWIGIRAGDAWVAELGTRGDARACRHATRILVGGECAGEIAVESVRPEAAESAEALILERVAELLAEAWLAARPLGPATRAIHAHETLHEGIDPVGFPIIPAATYDFRDLEEMRRVLADGSTGYLYSRWGNPTVRTAEAKIRSLEGAEESLLFSSGMGAISAVLLSLLRQGDTVVASAALYGETLRLLGRLDRWGIAVQYVEPADFHRIAGFLPPRTRAVWFEPLVNPTLRLVDPRPIARACRAAGAISVADNTFASPHNLRPLAYGIDLVVHSLTKYLSGHGDLTGGCVSGSRAAIAQIEPMRRSLGATLSAFDAFLVSRGLKTFALRMKQHAAGASQVAAFLAGHPRVRRVLYPGLASHPDQALAGEILATPGGMVTFEVDGGQPAAEALVGRLALCRCAASLGGIETLVSLPVLSSHYGFDDAQLAGAGISRGMVRLSVGLEDPEDVIADLRQALGSGPG